MNKINDDEVTKLANAHIEWFLSTLRPLLFSHFIHGFKHGAGSVSEPVSEQADSADPNRPCEFCIYSCTKNITGCPNSGG